MRRLPRFFAAVIVVAAIVLSPIPLSREPRGRAAAHLQPATETLDLATLSLSPFDLDAAGLTGYGEFGSAMLSVDELARQAAATLGLDPMSLRTALDDAGFIRRYQRELALPPAQSTPQARPSSTVTSYISQFATPAGAIRGFSVLESEAPAPRIKDLPDVAVIGEESEATRIRGVTGDRQQFRTLDITFRVENLVAGVTVTALGDQEPDLALGEALAGQLLTSLKTGKTGEPGLSNLILRLGGPEVETRADGYGRLDGETFPSYDETADELASRLRRYSNATSVYGVAQTVARGGRSRLDDARYGILLYRFATDAEAEAWLRNAVAHALDAPNIAEALPVPDAATIGDSSLTLELTAAPADTRTLHGYLVDTRVGSQVAQVQILGDPAPPLTAVEELARAQVACLQANRCNERLAPPADLALAAPATPVASTAGVCGSTPPLATPVAPAPVAPVPVENAANERPNIILILTDDLDSQAVACMPNIQALLAEQGTTFTNAFVTTPLCCPSRASILRGQYAHNHGVINNSGLAGGFPEFYNRDDEDSTIATWLNDAGYRTALFGKYLNRYPRGAGDTYIPPGWDTWSAFVSTTGDNRSDSAYYNYTLNTNGVLVSYGKESDDYSTDVLTAQATEFIVDAASSPDPFFVYLAPFAPHGPPTAAPRHAAVFADAGAPRGPSFDESDVSDKPAWVRTHEPLTPEQVGLIDDRYRRRLGALLAVDEMVATIVETLRETGTLDSTYLVFASDNGYHLGEHRLPIGKQSAYDEATHVPLIVRGPGVPAGATVEQFALNIDLAPTFAELAGVTTPDFVDGRSLAPFLHGREQAPWRRGLLVERFGNIPPDQWGLATPEPKPIAAILDDEVNDLDPRISPIAAPPYLALRANDYLYVEYANGERELYNLVTDPAALDNLAATADPAFLDELHARLEELRTCAAESCRHAEDDLPPYPD